MYKTNYINLFSLCIILCSIFAFQEKKEISTSKDFENFVTYFKEIDKNNDSEKIISTKNKNLLYNFLEWAEKNGTEKQIITIKILEISYLNKVKDDVEVIKKGELLLKNTRVEDFKDVVYMLQDLNQAYSRTEDYIKLLKGYTLYNNLLVEHNISSRESSKNNRIALTYYRLKNYEKAKEFFIKRGQGFIGENDYYGFSSANNDIGLCFLKMNKLDSAKFYFDKAIFIIDNKLDKNKKNNIKFKKVIEENIAEIWVKKGNYKKAKPILLKELLFSKTLQDVNRLQNAFYEVANIYYLEHKYKMGLNNIDSVFMLLKKEPNSNLKEKALFLKGKILLKFNKFDEADKYLRKAESFKDSIEQVKLKKQYLLAAVKFEIGKKDLELKKSLEKNKIDKATKTYQKIALFLLILLLLAMYFFLNKTLKDKKTITKQKIEAEKNSVEKELLLKELHHRVKNNLQVISSILELQSLETDNKELTKILKVGQDRIHSMSLIHQQLYQNNSISSINFNEYITKLIAHIKISNYQESVPVQFNIDAKSFNFPVNVSVPLGLIINELVTNAYKHAFIGSIEGKISITLEKLAEKNRYQLLVKDNGIGIEEKMDFTEIDTLGLKLVSLLSRQLNGTMHYKKDKGSSFIITFKDNITN